jgi:hypothetical protein
MEVEEAWVTETVACESQTQFAAASLVSEDWLSLVLQRQSSGTLAQADVESTGSLRADHPTRHFLVSFPPLGSCAWTGTSC